MKNGVTQIESAIPLVFTPSSTPPLDLIKGDVTESTSEKRQLSCMRVLLGVFVALSCMIVLIQYTSHRLYSPADGQIQGRFGRRLRHQTPDA